jgi:hypothetical protein
MPTINNGHLGRIKDAVAGFYNLDKPSYSGNAHNSYSPASGSERGDYTDVLRNAVAAVDAARAACPDIADQITIQRQAFLRNGSPGWRPTLTVYSVGKAEVSTAQASGNSSEMASMALMMQQMTAMLQMVNSAQASIPPALPVQETSTQSEAPTLPAPDASQQAYG